MASGGLPLRGGTAGISLAARVTPRSACDRVDGLVQTAQGVALKVRVRAVPEDGKANSAVEEVLAGWLGLARVRVRIEQGNKSRIKLVAIDGHRHELEALISERVAAFR